MIYAVCSPCACLTYNQVGSKTVNIFRVSIGSLGFLKGTQWAQYTWKHSQWYRVSDSISIKRLKWNKHKINAFNWKYINAHNGFFFFFKKKGRLL